MQAKIDFNDTTPLYEQIEIVIKNKITTGEIRAGEQIGSHHELSKKFGVSLITVKKALSNLVKDGILFTRVGKGTYVAEKQKMRVDLMRHKTIGLVLRDLKHPFFSMIVHSVEEKANMLGYNLLLSSSSGNMKKEESEIAHFMSLGVDGIIIASLNLEYRANDYLRKIHEENFPYIMVSYMHDPDYWYIGLDQEQGGYIATEHLINLGYRSIGYVHVGKGNLLCEVRKNGYYRALMEYDIPYDADRIFYPSVNKKDVEVDRFKLGFNFGDTFMEMNNKPEALFFYSDLVALGFLKNVTEKGIKVPDDVAIVGFDNIEVAKYASIPLTTVHQPVDLIGHQAVEIIQKRIDKKDIGNRTILKPELIIRDSSGAK